MWLLSNILRTEIESKSQRIQAGQSILTVVIKYIKN